MGHRACSGDRAGIGQEPSYRSFVSCRSGKLRFHRGSKRERDINTRLSARPAEMRGAAGRDLVTSISPCCHGAGTCWGSAWVGHTSSDCTAPCAGLWVRHGARTGYLPVSGPHKEHPMPCPAPWQGRGAHREWKQVWVHRLPHYISTLHPRSPHSGPALHTDPPHTQTVPPAQCRTPSPPLATDPSCLARQPSPVPGDAGATYRCAPQGTAAWGWTLAASAPAGHSWGCWGMQTHVSMRRHPPSSTYMCIPYPTGGNCCSTTQPWLIKQGCSG